MQQDHSHTWKIKAHRRPHGIVASIQHIEFSGLNTTVHACYLLLKCQPVARDCSQYRQRDYMSRCFLNCASIAIQQTHALSSQEAQMASVEVRALI